MSQKRGSQKFPSRVIGGSSGDYSLQIDVPPNRYAEFLIVNIANGDAGASKVIVSGQSKEAARAFNWVGGVTLNDDNHAMALAFSLGASANAFAPMLGWEKITHSQKRVFVRIDTVASNSVFVTVRFRMRELEIIPGPSHTVHPDHMQQMNIARAEAVRQRLGIEREIEHGEGLNARR